MAVIILKALRRIGRASALLLTVLVLFLSIVGASPALHRLIHADASAAKHNCAATLFAKGQISPATFETISDSFAPRFVETRPSAQSIADSDFDVRLAPNRGPPFC